MTAERRGGKAPASAEERTQERSDKRGRERERLRLTNGAKAPLDGSPPAKRRRGGSTAEGEARTGAGARRKGDRTLRQDGRTRNSTDRATRLLLKKYRGERRRAIGGRGRPRRSRPCGKFRREF